MITQGAICDFRLPDQRPRKWANALLSGKCPLCQGEVRNLSLHLFVENEDSMSLFYICEKCGKVFDWPHSYLAQGKNGKCVIPISVVKVPVWLTPGYVQSVENWHKQEGRDSRGRFCSYPLPQEIIEGKL